MNSSAPNSVNSIAFRLLSILLVLGVVFSALHVNTPAIASSSSMIDLSSITESKLLINDGEDDDIYGFSVALSGDIVVVGAYKDDEGSSNSGSAYVFQKIGGDWIQQAKLTDVNGVENEYFGYSVAVSGDIIVVGAPGIGSAFIYERNGASWDELTILSANTPDWFGKAVAINGDTIVVGAQRSFGASGAVFVYRRTGNNWVQEAQLSPSEGDISNDFGASVSISADTIAVGAFGDDDGGYNAEAVYIFQRISSSWTQQAKMIANDPAILDQLGFKVAIDGDVVVAGAPGVDIVGSDSGAAYVFRYDGSNWSQEVKLIAADAGHFQYFGISVAINGDLIVIGAENDDEGGESTGSVYIYEFTGAGWGLGAKLTASDASEYDLFGYAVSFDGDRIAVGAPAMIPRSLINPGSAYVYESVNLDYGTDTIGVYKPKVSRFKLRNTNDLGRPDIKFIFGQGVPDALPIVGDWNGDGIDTIGVYNPQTGQFTLRNTNSPGTADLEFAFGGSGNANLPITGDWDGNGVDTIGVYVIATGEFKLRNSNDSGPPDLAFIFNGGDLTPVAGDWNGDGVDTIGTFESLTGEFRLRNSNSAGPADIIITNPILVNAIPLTGDWDGDGVDTIGVYRKGKVFLRNTNDIGAADIRINYGSAAFIPVTGDWDGE